MVSGYAHRVAELVNLNREYARICEYSQYLTHKCGKLVEKTDYAPGFLTQHHIPQGKFMRLTPDFSIARRTVFRKEPVAIRGESYYLELKGYGAEGRNIYFHEFCSGDVYGGMYLELALREHRRAAMAVQLGLPVTLPVAVYEIPREEYKRVGMHGFRDLIGNVDFLEHSLREKVQDIIGPYEGLPRKIVGQRLLRHAQEHVGDDIEKQVAYLCKEFHSDAMELLGLNDKGKALLSGKPIGYLWRATKCPIRLGGPTDPKMDVPENHRIAEQMGASFRTLLEHGIVHHCPGTGNWTVAGELTDFADTFDLKDDRAELEGHLEYLVQERRIVTPTMEDFIRYLIGPAHNGVLVRSFLRGIGDQDLTRATRLLLERVPAHLR